MNEDIDIDCPYCGETNALTVDVLAGEQQFTEDCVVCCQPIAVRASADPENGVTHLVAEPENT
ncbi:CPXCG motif-containing cysteine-rich protein [Salinisphaera sp. USBA-960]|uniref:CPXCG motif-containing cysteine-rich protein n=1 Tax=Salinisphaera orenii TaxID=856731 RepID=UPI000DBE167D|nr:CPXCG motif-containing cysteine-rich protein [Salifodinibacter halophilus]NNC26817.1 CPXCG motif-containing cysteine-rich protein [Salifodinibacter halophilus]